MNHRHMFSHWEVSYDKFTSRVLYQLPAHYAPAATLQQHVQNRDFPSRREPPRNDIDEFKAKCSELRRLAAAQEQNNPVSFAFDNSWSATLRSDKHHYLEQITRQLLLPPHQLLTCRQKPLRYSLPSCFTPLVSLRCRRNVMRRCLSADWTGASLPPLRLFHRGTTKVLIPFALLDRTT